VGDQEGCLRYSSNSEREGSISVWRLRGRPKNTNGQHSLAVVRRWNLEKFLILVFSGLLVFAALAAGVAVKFNIRLPMPGWFIVGIVFQVVWIYVASWICGKPWRRQRMIKFVGLFKWLRWHRFPEIGLYWHIHHRQLFGWCYGYSERRKFIKEEKPASEHTRRLRLFRPVRGKLPDELIEAGRVLGQYRHSLGYAENFAHIANKYDKEIEALHKKECPNCPWDGDTIFPGEAIW